MSRVSSVKQKEEMTVSRSSKALPTAEEIWDLDKGSAKTDKTPTIKADTESSGARKDAGDKTSSIVPKK